MAHVAGKLLIVDDNAANLRAFTAILAPLGAEIVTAASGEQALRVLLREEVALILLDVQMPGMDGYQTARLIRSRERSRHVPIIFLTALPRDESFVVQGYELGAVDFIVKPVDATILCSKAQVFLELNEKAQIIREQTEQLRRASEQKLSDYQQALEMLAALSRRLGELKGGLSGLDQVLALALPVLGDAVIIDVRDVEGCTERIAVKREGTQVPELDDPRLDFGPSTVTFTAEKEVVLDVDAALASGAAQSGDHARFLAELGVASYACVPLLARERVLGAIAFFTAGSRRHYSEADLGLIEDVANRLATAIENLQLYTIARRERKKLEEASKAKDVFLATLSHEFRTPLNAIVGWSHLLKGGLDPSQTARAIDTIDRNARALAKLVGDLIDVSRIVSGNLKVEEKPVDFRQVVETSVDAARPSADGAGITLELAIADRPVRVVGDATRLQQVTGNILANAIKFTPKGGTIHIALAVQGETALLSVTDSGHGIAAEFLPYVFEPFRQGRRTHARSQEGLGLGLAIVKHLVELHGGKVRAESDGVGHGTTLRVELPLATPVSTSDFRELLRAETSAHASPDVMPETLLRGVHALVVEDDPDGCELLETVLRGFGATVTTAGTARDAYDALCARRPDVLVSDIGLPDEDGLALIRRVRETAALAGLPAVALTAYASKRDVAQALAAGFQAHVAKPVAPHELGTAIARVSGR